MAYNENTDDIHGFDLKLSQSMAKFNKVKTSDRNKQLVTDFLKTHKRKGIGKVHLQQTALYSFKSYQDIILTKIWIR